MELEQDNLAPAEAENASPEVNVDAGEGNVETEEKPKSWYDGLDADLKNDPSITKFKDPTALAKSYRELQKMIGKEKIVIPTEKSTPEEWNEFYKKVGRPEELTGYEAADVELPEEIKLRAETQEAFKKKAHELGLTKKQFSELSKFQAELSLNNFNQEVENIKSMTQKTETALRKKWGAAYESKVDKAQKVINHHFAGKNIHKAFKALSSDEGFVEAMAEIAESMGEDSIAGAPRQTMTPKEAQSELNKMLGDTKHPFHNEMSPEHAEAVNKYIELQQLAGM